jgi:hypothetical protein
MSKEEEKPEGGCEKAAGIPAIELDEWGLTGLSALLTFAPSVPYIEFGERRSGRDRRTGDRRVVGATGPRE